MRQPDIAAKTSEASESECIFKFACANTAANTSEIKPLNLKKEYLLSELYGMQEKLEQLAHDVQHLTELTTQTETVAHEYTERISETKMTSEEVKKGLADNQQLGSEFASQLERTELAPNKANEDSTSLTQRDSETLQHENDMLLLQLHQTQEMLEQYYLRYQKLAAEKQMNQLSLGSINLQCQSRS